MDDWWTEFILSGFVFEDMKQGERERERESVCVCMCVCVLVVLTHQSIVEQLTRPGNIIKRRLKFSETGLRHKTT